MVTFAKKKNATVLYTTLSNVLIEFVLLFYFIDCMNLGENLTLA